jgi:DNA-binding SARP family transcriptional activator/predicted ATPase
MPRLSLSLLGPFVATLDGQAVTFATAKTRALLAYLAVEADRPHARALLAGLLWPDQPDRDALKNLRNTLARLRAALGDHGRPGDPHPPFLLVSAQAIQLNPASDHWLDVAEFERQAGPQTTRPGSKGQDLALAANNLLLAADLYRGPFLAGLAVDSAAFEEWVLLRREQLDQQAQTAIRRLVTLLEQQGAYEAALPHARRALELNPWDEAAHRQLMHLLALGGRRGAALVQYETCRRLLAEELGVEPEPETTALCRRLRDAEWAQRMETDKQRAGALAVYPLESASVFVARERELARLDGWLARALAGQGQVAFVAGEAGSGKTALLDEFARRATMAHGALVVARGSCNAHAGAGDPYLPFREILQTLAGDVEGRSEAPHRRAGRVLPPEQVRRLWALLPGAAQALAEHGPDLIDTFVPGAALLRRVEAFAPRLLLRDGRLAELSRRGHGLTPRADLFAQVTAVLAALARTHPLLLLLDDLQWADGGTAALLFHLGRRLAGSRILVAGAHRPLAPGDFQGLVEPDESEERHPIASVIHEFGRQWGDVQVDLDQAEGRVFVDAILDTEPNCLDEPFRETLYRHTGGQALFTVELLRDMQERGDLLRDEAGHWRAGATLDWKRLPARVEAVVAERVGQPGPEGRALLAVASVEGEVFTAEVLARVQGVAAEEITRQLSGALSQAHRLVMAHGVERLEPEGRRLSRYRFRHVLFQQYLHHALDAVERARLHEAVGAALEALLAGHPDELASHAPELAWHFEAAGLPEKAAEYLLCAGRRAYWLSAPQEAITLCRRGLALLETRPDSDERARRELELQLALDAPCRDVYGWGSPEQTLALTRAYQLGQRLGEPARLLPALRALCNLGIAGAQHEHTLALARQILSLAEQAQEPAHVVFGHHMFGRACTALGDLRAAREHMERALALYRQQWATPPESPSMWEPDTEVSLLMWLPQDLWMLGCPDQALARSQEALALAQKLAHAPTIAAALTVAVVRCRILRREVQAAAECVEQLRCLVIKKNLAAYQPWVSLFQGWVQAHRDRGQAAAGLAQIHTGMSALQAVRPYRLTLLAETCWQAGQVAAGLEVLDEALALVERTNARTSEAEMWRLRGELLRLRAEAEVEVESCFRKAIEVAQRQEAKSWELRATTSLARLWQEQGRTEEARAALSEVYGRFSEGFDTPDLIEARALLAEIGKAWMQLSPAARANTRPCSDGK